MFILSGSQWYFAGAYAVELKQRTDSYNAEAYAAVVALKAIHDTCKIIGTVQASQPEVHLIYDPQTVGQQMLGHWATQSNSPVCQLLRGLANLITARFGVELKGWHTKGHRGDIGNEIADVLTGQAAKGNALMSSLTTFSRLLIGCGSCSRRNGDRDGKSIQSTCHLDRLPHLISGCSPKSYTPSKTAKMPLLWSKYASLQQTSSRSKVALLRAKKASQAPHGKKLFFDSCMKQESTFSLYKRRGYATSYSLRTPDFTSTRAKQPPKGPSES